MSDTISTNIFKGAALPFAISTSLAIFALSQNIIGNVTSFFVLKLLTTLSIIYIVYRYRNRKLDDFNKYVLRGLCLCLVGDAAVVHPELFGLATIIFGIVHLHFMYGVVSFQGYTYNTKSFLFLVSIPTLFFLVYASFLDGWVYVFIVYALIQLFYTWQALNLYLARKNYGTLIVLWSAVMYIFTSVLSVVHSYVSADVFADTIAAFFYWISIGLLAYATTLKDICFLRFRV